MTITSRQLQNVLEARRAELLPALYRLTQGIVQTGPFKGQQILPKFSWGDGDTASKLLGLYEDELHFALEQGFAANPDFVINVGCAEGYYAVGAKMRTNAFTIAVDVSSESLRICKENAAANGVTIDQVRPSIDTEALQSLIVQYQRPLIISDCEGYEESLLDIDAIPELARCMMLIESHDCVKEGLTAKLMTRFEPTHHVIKIDAKGKDPFQFEFLKNWWDIDKMALVCEGRPMHATWVWAVPK